jgi:hypothetical protein
VLSAEEEAWFTRDGKPSPTCHFRLKNYLSNKGTGSSPVQEPVLYVEGYFGNFKWCEITKIPLNIKDWLLSSWSTTGEDANSQSKVPVGEQKKSPHKSFPTEEFAKR